MFLFPFLLILYFEFLIIFVIYETFFVSKCFYIRNKEQHEI